MGHSTNNPNHSDSNTQSQSTRGRSIVQGEMREDSQGGKLKGEMAAQRGKKKASPSQGLK